MGVENPSAADRGHRRFAPHDQRLIPGRDGRLGQKKLHRRRIAWKKLRPVEKRDGCQDFGRADNLMITEAITATGGSFIADDENGAARLAALGAFRRALSALAK